MIHPFIASIFHVLTFTATVVTQLWESTVIYAFWRFYYTPMSLCRVSKTSWVGGLPQIIMLHLLPVVTPVVFLQSCSVLWKATQLTAVFDHRQTDFWSALLWFLSQASHWNKLKQTYLLWPEWLLTNSGVTGRLPSLYWFLEDGGCGRGTSRQSPGL